MAAAADFPSDLNIFNTETYAIARNIPKGDHDIISGLNYLPYTFLTIQAITVRGELSMCVDTGAGISLVDAEVARLFFPHCTPAPMPGNRHIGIRGVGAGSDASNVYITPDIVMKTTGGSLLTIQGELHLVKHLGCNVILANDILSPAGATIDVQGQAVRFFSRYTVKARAMRGVVRAGERGPPPDQKQRKARWIAIRAASAEVVEPGKGIPLPVSHAKVAADVNWLLEPMLISDRKSASLAGLPRAIIDPRATILPFANLGTTPIAIRKRQILGYIAPVENHNLTRWPATVLLAAADDEEAENPLQVPEPVTAEPVRADISDHLDPDDRTAVQEIINRHHRLFRPTLGLFADGTEMPLRFMDETDFTGLKQRPYPLSRKDREVMDRILDPLLENGRIERVPLGDKNPIASPAFIVWNKGKPRVVVDLRKVNMRLLPNAYPLPTQQDVLQSLGGSTLFSSMDIQQGFFQQPIREDDRFKTTFGTPHRGLERFTVATMGLATSPGFFQQRMEEVLTRYLWQFALVYVDDIIIYSPGLGEHLKHLDRVFAALEASGVTMSLKKCHFAYPSVALLGHHVGRLGISTQEEKVEAIRNLAFPETLGELEGVVGLFNYYRDFVDFFADTIEALEALKTRLLRNSPRSGNQRASYTARTKVVGFEDSIEYKSLVADARLAFDAIKQALINAPTRAYPDFKRPFILYVDASKQRGIGVALHQVGTDGIERPILFLSRRLNAAERRYWATELECLGLIWALRKLPQYLDGEFTVVTDHIALVSALQSPATGHRSNRLANWALVLSAYLPRMKIRYRKGASHDNVDALSRLRNLNDDSENVPPSDYDKVRQAIADQAGGPADVYMVSATGVEFADELKERLREDLPHDATLGKIFRKASEVDQYHSFTVRDGLLYFEESRLCIPKSFAREVIRMCHDVAGHPGLHRTEAILRKSFFLPHARKRILDRLSRCSSCQVAKPPNHSPWGRLHPIPPPKEPFEVLAIDFITGLPISDGYNTILTVTDKFSKAIILIAGKETWDAPRWAESFYRDVVCRWQPPLAIISDRDHKFTAQFWKALLRLMGIKSWMTTAYNPQSNGQSERSNLTVEVTLRTILVGKYEAGWSTLLPQVERTLNSVAAHSTSISPFQLMTGVKPRWLPIANGETATDATEFLAEREAIRKDVLEQYALIQARMAEVFDRNHRPPTIQVGDWVFINLARKGQKGYAVKGSSKLSPLRIGPFRVIEKRSEVAFRLKLPTGWRMHPVISTTHLERTELTEADMTHPPPEPVIVDGQPQFEVERIMGKREEDGRTYLQIKWRGYDELTWEPFDVIAQDTPELVKAFMAKKPRGRPRKK